MTDEIDDLFDVVPPGQTWHDGLPEDQAAWIQLVAARAKSRGRLPSKSLVAAAFKKKFGVPTGCHLDTLRENIKRLAGL